MRTTSDFWERVSLWNQNKIDRIIREKHGSTNKDLE